MRGVKAGRSLGAVALLTLIIATGAHAQVPPLPDPTGRSGQPPPFREAIHRPPQPGQIMPSPPPSREFQPLGRLRVFVREIRVVGSTVFSSEQLAAVTGPYTNREVTAEDLESLRLALTRLYIDRG